jgi:hypothetical protein
LRSIAPPLSRRNRRVILRHLPQVAHLHQNLISKTGADRDWFRMKAWAATPWANA